MFSKIVISIVILIYALNMVQASTVIDSLSQKGIYISDYCPKMKYCEEGSHVMCMYYNPQWDNELATFAQVLANQCVLRHDMCRATKKFPDPGQTAGLVRFSYPDWYPVSKAGHFTKPGLSASKLLYAVIQTLKSWYGQKGAVTANMITSYPDWSQNPNNQAGRLYLEMIYGPATHMGCGISAYTEYAYYDNHAALNYNSVQVICNYSARSRKGGSVYDTAVPRSNSTSEFTIRCGCPRGSDEDADCLCYNTPKKDVTSLKIKTYSNNDLDCNPSVVLLPIFTVEDAPSHKLINGHENERNTTLRDNLMDVLDFEETSLSMSTKEPHIHRILNGIINSPRPKMTLPSRPLKRVTSVKNRYFTKKSVIPDRQHHHKQSPRPSSGHVSSKRSSIFSRTTIFEMPKHKENTRLKILRDIKKDVIPRKDFTNVKNLVRIYMKDRRNKIGVNQDASIRSEQKIRENKLDVQHKQILRIKVTTESFLNTAEEEIINDYHYLKGNFQPNTTSEVPTEKQLNIISSHEEGDKKLMTLLDKLEQEVKHIELHGNKKDIFDAKIRKIYNHVIGKPVNLISKQADILKRDTSYNEISNKFFKNNVSNDKEIMVEYDKENKSHKDIEEIGTRNLKMNMNEALNEGKHNMRPVSKITNQNTLTSRDEKTGTEYRNLRKNYDDEIINKHHYEKIARDNHERLYDDQELNKKRYSNRDDIRNIYRRNDKSSKYLYDDEIFNNRNHIEYDDVLGPERRQYYQDKLDNLERKIQNTRNFRHRSIQENNRHVRRMRPTNQNNLRSRRIRTQMEPLYMPDRARFLHGF
ncbi:uncharacterized protein LOC113514501 isoform X2 [Galleria mellonella]|uniref:Uncharacterized protein LOC113514501 isoform X2 n=1 Tax=Galleria mellonella TaxID=7137 RepID=A0ABM3MN60_GALME|nr:uncharacterized protein LOC113514501 isoform X2 [Galleria mellonella]